MPCFKTPAVMVARVHTRESDDEICRSKLFDKGRIRNDRNLIRESCN